MALPKPARFALLAILAATFAVLVAACGGGDDEDDGGEAGGAPTTETGGTETGGGTGPAIRVGLVTDIGGLDDRSFNFLANQGLTRAEEQLGIEGRVVISRSNADYVPNL